MQDMHILDASVSNVRFQDNVELKKSANAVALMIRDVVGESLDDAAEADELEQIELDEHSVPLAPVGGSSSSGSASGAASSAMPLSPSVPAGASGSKYSGSFLNSIEQGCRVTLKFLAFNGSYDVRSLDNGCMLGVIHTLSLNGMKATCKRFGHDGKCVLFINPRARWEEAFGDCVRWLSQSSLSLPDHASAAELTKSKYAARPGVI
jgi:hypothetical protein